MALGIQRGREQSPSLQRPHACGDSSHPMKILFGDYGNKDNTEMTLHRKCRCCDLRTPDFEEFLITMKEIAAKAIRTEIEM